MRTIIMQFVLPIACYFIGVYIGDRRGFDRAWDIISQALSEDIQHVGYTPEQMGYDK